MTTPFAARTVAALSLCFFTATLQARDEIEEIVVTADFRERPADQLPASVTVLAGDFLEEAAVQHFEELVNAVPNLNWSGDGHRARYFQIRGIGELEQYEGAPNPSVGFLIDDIDFSGIGTVATLFDVESIEVLRGPQGSRYGANALAGLIYVRSTGPGAGRGGRLQLTLGDDDTTAIGAAFGGALDDEAVLFRLSAHRHESNGFRRNAYLGRKDTNGRQETAARARFEIEAGEALDVNATVFFSDIDDGYDAFALDNSYTMLSDKPGRDSQRSAGASIRFDWDGPGKGTLTVLTAFANSDIGFGFDADWGNADSWAPFIYDYISSTDRERRTLSQEVRYVDDDWLVGIYASHLGEDLLTVNRGEYFDPVIDFADSLDDTFSSDFASTNVALFGQRDWWLGERTRFGSGVRVERRTTDYSDTGGLVAAPSETMWGGEVSLGYDVSDEMTTYLSISKGYKAGGFNLGIVPSGQRNFRREALWTAEAGVKAELRGDSLRLNAAVFVGRHDDQQVRVSEQLVPGDPASFVFFTSNDAASGETMGLEADLAWGPSDRWNCYASLGLLNTRLGTSGRARAHAPRYTLAAGAAYRHPGGFFARLDVSASDEFYFDVSHDQRSKAYELVHARTGFEGENWTVEFWARNLTDETYAVRGFFFGNEPPDFPNSLYTRLGDPRHLGVTIERSFY